MPAGDRLTSHHPQPGDVLAGRYRVVRTIGRGGMGIVLEARNTVTQKRVAIKWLLADYAASPEAGERLLREATAASRISHPNVVDVYDVLQEGEAVFLVMDLLRGEPLDALLQRGGMPVHQLISLLLPAMEGVAEAHRHDIIHRDIHPGNIFIAHEGSEPRLVPKVLDFGISKLGGGDQPRLTRSNISMGTPVYMSYEQLYSARDVDRRADVYSFGVILYQILTGRRPFDGDSFVEVAGQITAGKPVHPKELRPEIPGPLAELTLWAMAKQREDRIDSLEQLMAELAPFATERTFRLEMSGERPTPIVPPQYASSSLPLGMLPERASVSTPRPRTPGTPRPSLLSPARLGDAPSSAPPAALEPVPPRSRAGWLALVTLALVALMGLAAYASRTYRASLEANEASAPSARASAVDAGTVALPHVEPPPLPTPTPAALPPVPVPAPRPSPQPKPAPAPKPAVVVPVKPLPKPGPAPRPEREACVDSDDARRPRAGRMRCSDL